MIFKGKRIGIAGVILVLVGAVVFYRSGPRRFTELSPVAALKPALQVRPATREEKRSPGLKASERPKALMQVDFDAAVSGKLGEAIPVSIQVQAQPLEGAGDPVLELLIRLPVGVRLPSEGWEPVPLPPEEAGDSSGPWTLFQKKRTLTERGKSLPVKEEIALEVREPGTNWIITARARLTRGDQSRQAFGVLFASVTGDRVEFHRAPRMGSERAETNRP